MHTREATVPDKVPKRWRSVLDQKLANRKAETRAPSRTPWRPEQIAHSAHCGDVVCHSAQNYHAWCRSMQSLRLYSSWKVEITIRLSTTALHNTSISHSEIRDGRTVSAQPFLFHSSQILFSKNLIVLTSIMPTHLKLKWRNGVSIPQAESIDPSVWEDHREIIERKYHQGTLEELMKFMKQEHNFEPTFVYNAI
jgi:Clr5 domain